MDGKCSANEMENPREQGCTDPMVYFVFFKAEVSSFRYKKQNAHIGLVLNSVQTAVYSGPCSQRTLTN